MRRLAVLFLLSAMMLGGCSGRGDDSTARDRDSAGGFYGGVSGGVSTGGGR